MKIINMLKNTFYFTLGGLFVVKIFKFYLDFSPMQKNGLVKKVRSISKFMTSQAGKHKITIHISPNILKSKDNQIIRFGGSINRI